MTTDDAFEMVSRAKLHLLFTQSMSDEGDAAAYALLTDIQGKFIRERSVKEDIQNWVCAVGAA